MGRFSVPSLSQSSLDLQPRGKRSDSRRYSQRAPGMNVLSSLSLKSIQRQAIACRSGVGSLQPVLYSCKQLEAEERSLSSSLFLKDASL